MGAMNIEEEVEIIKKELIDIIIQHLRENKLDLEKAQKLASDFLEELPIQDQKDLLKKLKELGEKYKEVEEIYVEELGKAEQEKRNTALNTMRDYIKQGKIEDAITIAKSARL